jgi:hypothetical protein
MVRHDPFLVGEFCAIHFPVVCFVMHLTTKILGDPSLTRFDRSREINAKSIDNPSEND